jgi:hypothetical protein
VPVAPCRDGARAERRVSDTRWMLVVGIFVLATVPLALIVFTGIGAHRRGVTIPRSVLWSHLPSGLDGLVPAGRAPISPPESTRHLSRIAAVRATSDRVDGGVNSLPCQSIEAV